MLNLLNLKQTWTNVHTIQMRDFIIYYQTFSLLCDVKVRYGFIVIVYTP